MELSLCITWSIKYIPSGAGSVVAVDESVVDVVDGVDVEETVEVSAVVKVAVDEVVDNEVFAVDGSFDAAAEKES